MSTDAEKLAASLVACQSVLRRIQENPDIRYLIGAGSQTFGDVTEAYALLTDQPVADIRNQYIAGSSEMYAATPEAEEPEVEGPKAMRFIASSEGAIKIEVELQSHLGVRLMLHQRFDHQGDFQWICSHEATGYKISDGKTRVDAWSNARRVIFRNGADGVAKVASAVPTINVEEQG